MRIVDFLSAEDILSDLRSGEKLGALGELADLIGQRHALNPKSVFSVLLERERLASTGIGEGVAIPHGKLSGAPGLCAVLGRSAEGIPFDSVDGGAAHIFFALIAPENSAGLHLKALARISRLLKDGELRRRLISAGDMSEMYHVLGQEDAKY